MSSNLKAKNRDVLDGVEIISTRLTWWNCKYVKFYDKTLAIFPYRKNQNDYQGTAKLPAFQNKVETQLTLKAAYCQ